MSRRFFTWLSITLLLITSAGTKTVLAQDKKITCESNGGDYKYCRVETENNVRLEKQISISECRHDYSWGYDRHGIWVDRGCRAEFSYGKDNGAAVALGGAIIGGAILAGVLASRHNNNNNDTIRSNNAAYNFGYNEGRNDALGGLSQDSGRHSSGVDNNYRSSYRDGYTAGFREGADTRNHNSYGSNSANDQRDAYQQGYKSGSYDAQQNRSSDYTRYRNDYNRNTRDSFRNGYEAGYKRNNWDYDRGNSNSRVPNWLIGTWQADQGTQYLNVTFSTSGQITVEVVPKRGRRSTSSGYYQNGTMVFPNFASYDIRREGGQMVAVNVRDKNDRTVYKRIR